MNRQSSAVPGHADSAWVGAVRLRWIATIDLGPWFFATTMSSFAPSSLRAAAGAVRVYPRGTRARRDKRHEAFGFVEGAALVFCKRPGFRGGVCGDEAVEAFDGVHSPGSEKLCGRVYWR